jgi:hypothetical protein
MIWLPDISIIIYQGQVWWYRSIYHGTCAAGWRVLGAPGARSSTSFGLAIAKVLRTSVQLSGDGLDDAWSRAWTCCCGCCAGSALRPICSHWKKSARRGHRRGLCSQVRIQLEIALLITMVLNSFIDCLYALTVCALLRWSWLKAYMGRVITADEHPLRPSRPSPWIRVATPPM